MTGVTQPQNSLERAARKPAHDGLEENEVEADRRSAKAQWARASLKKAIRPPTTNEPTDPQTRLTRISASSAWTLKENDRKEPLGNSWVKPVIQGVSQWSLAWASSGTDDIKRASGGDWT